MDFNSFYKDGMRFDSRVTRGPRRARRVCRLLRCAAARPGEGGLCPPSDDASRRPSTLEESLLVAGAAEGTGVEGGAVAPGEGLQGEEAGVVERVRAGQQHRLAARRAVAAQGQRREADGTLAGLPVLRLRDTGEAVKRGRFTGSRRRTDFARAPPPRSCEGQRGTARPAMPSA